MTTILFGKNDGHVYWTSGTAGQSDVEEYERIRDILRRGAIAEIYSLLGPHVSLAEEFSEDLGVIWRDPMTEEARIAGTHADAVVIRDSVRTKRFLIGSLSINPLGREHPPIRMTRRDEPKVGHVIAGIGYEIVLSVSELSVFTDPLFMEISAGRCAQQVRQTAVGGQYVFGIVTTEETIPFTVGFVPLSLLDSGLVPESFRMRSLGIQSYYQLEKERET